MLYVVIDKILNPKWGEFDPAHIEKLFQEYKNEISSPPECNGGTIIIQSCHKNTITDILAYAKTHDIELSNIIVDNRIDKKITPISLYM